MTLRTIFAAKAAAAVLAIGLAGQAGSALAADGPAGTASAPMATATIASPQPQASSLKGWDGDIHPTLPASVLYALVAASLLAGAVNFRTNKAGAILRSVSGLAIVGALLHPEILKVDTVRQDTEVVVVKDKTASQTTIAGRSEATEAVHKALMEKLKAIKGIRVREVTVGNAAGQSQSDGSNLFTAIENINDLDTQQVGAVILETDGQVHDVPGPQAWPFKAPLHVLLSGQDKDKDRRIVLDEAPHYALIKKIEGLPPEEQKPDPAKDEKPTIKFHIVDDGMPPGATVPVTVTIDGKETRTTVKAGPVVELPITITRGGSNIIEVRTDPMPGELTDKNNVLVTAADGARPNLNVLMLSGSPDPGIKMWRDLLQGDSNTNFIEFAALRLPEKQDTTPANQISLIPFPFDTLFSEKLGQFDVIILDQLEDNGLLPTLYYSKIAEFVNKGGALLVVAGPEYTGERSLYNKLSALLPAKPDGNFSQEAFHPAVSAAGKRHPVTRSLPAGKGPWYFRAGVQSPTGNVVLEGPHKTPLMALDHKGEGRVAMIFSNQTRNWHVNHLGGGPAKPLLTNAMRWLMKYPDMDEEALRLNRVEDTIVIEQQTMGDTAAPVTIKSPSGKTQTVTPKAMGGGLWQATLPAGEQGLYKAWQEGTKNKPAYIGLSQSDDKEFGEMISTFKHVGPLVEKTGGLARRMNDAAGSLYIPRVELREADAGDQTMSGADWIGIRRNGAVSVTGIKRWPVPPALELVLIFSLLAATYAQESGRTWWRRDKGDKVPHVDGPGGVS